MTYRKESNRQEVPKMAQWQYSTMCTDLDRSIDFDEDLRKILQDYGMRGWELV